MADRLRSQKQVQVQRSRRLRAAGRTWGEVATDFRHEYRVNARVALRLAHGWSQGDVADQWNKRWPDDPKTFKNISYWEQWPAATGYTPSLDVLARLAVLYQCHIVDLLADATDHRGEDPIFQARQDLAHLPAAIAGGSVVFDEPRGGAATNGADLDALAKLVTRLEESDVRDLARDTVCWATQINSALDRRSLLLKLSFALTMAAAIPEGSADSDSGPDPLPGAESAALSGIWRSEYAYYSSGRGKQFSGVHYVVIRQQGPSLTVESLPHSTGSQLAMSLSLDGMTVTGTWEEQTSPTVYYKGAIYRGAMQLLVSPSGGQMSGLAGLRKALSDQQR